MIIKHISNTLIIIGSMLCLTTAARAWTISMNFNQGPLGQVVEGKGTPYPVFSDAAGRTIYSTCPGNIQTGHCAEMSIKKGSDGWGTWGGRLNFKQLGVTDPGVGTSIWMSVKVFMPLGFDYTANPHLKFMRIHTSSKSVQNEGYDDLYITPIGSHYYNPGLKKNLLQPPFFFVKEQQNLLKRFGNNNLDRPKLGVWETYEVYMKMDYRSVANGGTSRVRIWKNGKLLAELNDIQTLKSKVSYADNFLIFTYWNGGKPNGTGSVPSKNQHLFIDDLIVTTDTPSNRDILGNPMIGDVLIMPNPPTSLFTN